MAWRGSGVRIPSAPPRTNAQGSAPVGVGSRGGPPTPAAGRRRDAGRGQRSGVRSDRGLATRLGSSREDARITAWRAADGWRRRMVGAFVDDRLIGFSTTSTAHDTPGTAWIDASVLPRHQSGGVGTRLVRAAESVSPAGSSRFVASAYRPSAAGIESLVQRFAQPLGYTC